MKSLKLFLMGLLALLAAGVAFASATAITVSGNVTAQSGAAARVVRQGDTLRAGETVVTGVGSSAVLKFEDGQIAALSGNSRLVISSFEYNPGTKTGSIVLDLISGGMRAITGLIGRNSPQRVTYKVSNYTIGIRGTDVTIAAQNGNAVVTVTEGVISFTFGTQTISVPAGQGVNAKTDGTFQAAAISTIVQQLQATPEGQQMLNSIQGVQSISLAVSRAAAGESGTVTPSTETGTSGSPTFTPAPSGPAGSGGGGTASGR